MSSLATGVVLTALIFVAIFLVVVSFKAGRAFERHIRG